MMLRNTLVTGVLWLAGQGISLAQSPVPVTVDNFVRAESDLYLGNLAKGAGLGKLEHRREPANIDKWKFPEAQAVN